LWKEIKTEYEKTRQITFKEENAGEKGKGQ